MTTPCKLAGVLAACLAAQLAASGRGAQTPLTAAEQRDGWTLLFDGRSLDGWRGYNRPDGSTTQWKVEDGQLTVPPSGGRDTRGARDLITTATFRQFDLTWEWRIATGGNSGLKYFVLEDRDAAIGHEYQMIDDERHADAKIGPHRQTAAFYDVFAASNRPMKPAGEWNTSRVLVRGNHVEHWLNGQRVLQYELDSPELRAAIEKSKFKGIERFGKPQDGHILIQDHGDRVWFRNIRIRKIP
jgi:hypothetical protein